MIAVDFEYSPSNYVVITRQEYAEYKRLLAYISYCRKEWDAGRVPMSLMAWEQETK